MRTIICITLGATCAFASTLPRDSVHLAVNPKCGGSLSGSPSDVNAGIPSLNSFTTIVAFGDSYTDGGVHDGSQLLPAILKPPSPRAGGRASNGRVWVEYLASTAGATVKDYAVDGAVIDVNQWPGVPLAKVNDFLTQVNLFIGQYPKPNPDTTLYTVFLGIGDFEQSNAHSGSSLDNIAGDLIYTILRLISSPIFGKNILVVDNYGRGKSSAAGESYKQQVFEGLNAIRGYGANVAFVDLSTVWNGILGTNPGPTAFGYTSNGACLSNPNTTVGSCSDPDHTFYWLPGTPSTATHKIVADYVQRVLTECKV